MTRFAFLLSVCVFGCGDDSDCPNDLIFDPDRGVCTCPPGTAPSGGVCVAEDGGPPPVDGGSIDGGTPMEDVDGGLPDLGGECTPTGAEVCDGIDNDCDANVDEGAAGDCAWGVCRDGACEDPVAVDSFKSHTCVVLRGGGVACWGQNLNQSISEMVGHALSPMMIEGLPPVVSLSVGDFYACAVTTDGEVWCWGSGSNGRLGDGTTESRAVPRRVDGLPMIAAVWAGGESTFATAGDGTFYAWGSDRDGALLVDGTGDDVTTPELGNGLALEQVSSNRSFRCAVTSGSEVSCWGRNSAEGRLGVGATNTLLYDPTALSLTDAAEVQVGGSHGCARLSGGQVWCWGEGSKIGSNGIDSSVPKDVTGLSDAVELEVADNHSCALRSNGRVACWGLGTRGQLGQGSADSSSTFVNASGITSAVDIAVGRYHTCAVLESGHVMCWGDGEFGELGAGSPMRNVTTPIQVEPPL